MWNNFFHDFGSIYVCVILGIFIVPQRTSKQLCFFLVHVYAFMPVYLDTGAKCQKLDYGNFSCFRLFVYIIHIGIKYTLYGKFVIRGLTE